MPISLEKALSIAKEFSHEISDAYPGKILAVFAIGSLGGGYYRPGQSDIDTVVITSGQMTRRSLSDNQSFGALNGAVI